MFQGLLNIKGIWVQHRVSPEPFNLSLRNFHRMLILYKTFIWTNNKKIVTWPLAVILEVILKIWKMPINNYFMQKHPSTSGIRHQDLFWYIVSVVEGHVIPMDMFSIFLIFAKSNDITNMFVKSILVWKIAYTSIYDIIMSPEHFEVQNK